MNRHSDLKIVSGGSLGLMLFGLPFALAGAFIVYGGITGSVKNGSTGEAASIFLWLPFALFFGGAGFVMIFGRIVVRFRRDVGRIVKVWSVIVPLRKLEYAIEDFTKVRLNREVRGSHKNRSTVFPVYLEGAQNMKVKETRHFIDARLAAEQVAKYFEIPMENSIPGQEGLREPHELDHNLAQQLKDSDERVREPDLPNGSSIILEKNHESISMTLPKTIPFMLIIPAIPMTFFMFIAWGMIGMGDWDQQFGMKIIAFIAFSLPALGMIFAALYKYLSRYRIVISTEALRVTRELLFLRWSSSIQLSDLEELHLPPALPGFHGFLKGLQPILAISDHQRIAFANGQNEAVQKYVYEMIRYAVAQRA